MAYQPIKVRQRTYDRLDFYRNEDQTFDDAINELLDTVGTPRMEDILKEFRRTLREMKKHGGITLEELEAHLKQDRARKRR